MATSAPVLKLNARVSVAAGQGYIRFVGPTSFSTGKWVGVELDTTNGKNDGSLQGKRYFTTEEGRGVFVKPSGVQVLGEEGAGQDEFLDEPTRPSSRPLLVSKPPSRPLSRTGVSRPPSRTSIASGIGSGVARPPTTSTPLSRGPSKTGLTSGRGSALGARSPSPQKLPTLRAASKAPPSAPGMTVRTVSTSSSTSSSVPPPPSTSAPLGLRAISPRKLVSPSAPPNFAPPAGGTSPRLNPTRRLSTVSNVSGRVASPTRNGGGVSPPPNMGGLEAVFMTRGASGSSTSSFGGGGGSLMERTFSSASLGSGREGATSSRSMQRQFSGGQESLLEEEPIQHGWAEELELEQDGERRAETEPEKENPFSLRPVESRKLAEATVPKKDFDELVAKLRIIEARRAEDREKLREVDRYREEAEDWGKVKEKSKAKITELSADLRELRQANKELTAERNTFESKFADLSDQVEISLLDKEVAEERFEAAEAGLEAVRERVAELEVEVAVLKEETAKMEGEGEAAIAQGASGESRVNALAFIQLEKQNGRLKDALVRLRDLTSETEVEQKRRIIDLEKELDLTSDLQVMFDNTVVELERAEGQLEDVKQQLDDALGAEDLLEQLTERNLSLSEKYEELVAAVEDLEALQELSNELEENHVETEKQMQEEIDLKDLQLREQQQRAEALEESVADYEGTINQFRELVLSLQSDLENLREHQATQQSASATLTSQSQAMLNLNLKLQSSVLKSQVKTIDLELRKLDAQQARENLAITKPYLLPAFFEEDSDAVDSLLFFERLAYKADLISMVIEQNHNVTESLNTVVPETLVAICDTRTKLARYSALNKRFAAQLKRCSPEIFLKMGQVYHEVSATEKRIDSFIDALKREDLREVECGREVDGLIAQAEHLAELHLQEPMLDLAERELAYVAALDLDFDTIAAAAGFVKQSLATISQDPDVEVEVGDVSLDDALFKPLQTLVNQARNSKVVTKKLLRRLDELLVSSSALSIEHAQGFETLAYNSSAIANAAAKLATDVALYCSELRTSKQPLQLTAVLAIAQEVVETELGKPTRRPFDEIGALLAQLAQDVATTLTIASDTDHVVKLSYQAPWIARVLELQSNAAVNVEAERKVVKLNEEMRDLVREMRTKDQAFQESTVKIELMEKRMEAVKKQADAMGELETELLKSKKQERAYEEAIEALQGDLDTMEQENVKLKQNAPAADKPGASNAVPGDGETIAYEGNMETSRLIEQIESLRGAVRFLRSENSYLKSQDLLAELEELPSYSSPPASPAPPQPLGIPSRLRESLPQDPLTLRQSITTESKLLLHEARVLSATPRMVDLSLVKPGGKLGGWQPSARAPANQLLAEKERVLRLGRKVDKLWQMRPLYLGALS